MKITAKHKRIAAENGISESVLINRVNRLFWPVERAISERPMTQEEKIKHLEELRKNNRSPHWSSDGGTFLRCPVEGCMHVGDIITKAHCRLEHGMERDEVKELYGMPHKVQINGQKRFKNSLYK